MADVYWTCPVCDYEARDEEEKREHIKETMNDPAHIRAREMMEKGEGIKEKAEDVPDKIS